MDLFVILDFIFPPSDDELIVREVSDLNYSPTMVNQDICALSNYKNDAVRSAIHLAKFHNHRKAKMLLAEILKQFLSHQDKDVLIIPIPLSRQRLQKRGYNQVTEVLKVASKNRRIDYSEKILIRTRHTTSQTSLNKSARIKNMKVAFAVRNFTNMQNFMIDKDIILLDDVTTTGATLEAAKAALWPLHPSSITCVALAH